MKSWRAYLVTISSVVSVGFLKVGIFHYFGVQSVLTLSFTAICISAWYGGFFQGFLATISSLLFGSYFLIEPTLSWQNIDYEWKIRLGLFVIDGLVISTMCAQLRSSQRKTLISFKSLKKTEESLRKSEARLRHAYDSNMMGFVFTDRKGRVSYCNQYFANMLGRTVEEITSENFDWYEITPSEYFAQRDEVCRLMKANLPIPPYEKEYIRADGTRISALVGVHQLGANEVAGFILDISERKKAEMELFNTKLRLEENIAERTKQLTEANQELSKLVKQREITTESLRESQSFLNSVIENIPNMIFVKDAKNLRFIRFNKAGEELLGYKRVQLIGKNDYDFFPKEEADFFTQNDRLVLQGKTVVDITEETLSTREGIRFLHTKKIPILDKHGVPQYLLGISEDITKRKEAERQSMQLIQEQAARSVAEKTAERLKFLSDASATLNESLDINSMLKSFSKVVIANIADWCAIDFYDDKTDSRERIVTEFSDAKLAKQVETWLGSEHKVSHPAGKSAETIQSQQARLYANVDEEVLSEAIKNSEDVANLDFKIKSCMIVPLIYFGKVFGTLSFASSKANRVYNEFDLSIAQDLAKRASFAIENANLYSKAQDASRTKSAFLANMSHEIRTPLGAMIGFAELAQESSTPPAEQNHYISTIIRNGRQLLQIVDEILDLSKVESDRIQIEKVPFDLHRLISEVHALLNVKAFEKNLCLSMEASQDLPEYVLTDPTRLRQILINVIGNAIKFTEVGGVDVTARFLPAANNVKAGILEFIIADSGIGISQAQINKLFQPFVQADESMTRKFGGTGLGLFLSRKLARLLGGDLTLKESTAGQGSKFKVEIEIETVDNMEHEHSDSAHLDPHHSHNKTVPSEYKENPTYQGRILIVDDAPDNRMIVSIYLTKMGLQYELAENGLQGVDKALHQKFDLVLMDIQMPELDGFEAVKMLRTQNYNGPIIALTAHAMKGDKERCLKRGFDDYLSKPLSKESLRHTIKKYLHKAEEETTLH